MLRLLTNFPTPHGPSGRAHSLQKFDRVGEEEEEEQCQCVTVCDRFDKPLSVVLACHPLDYSPTC